MVEIIFVYILPGYLMYSGFFDVFFYELFLKLIMGRKEVTE